MFGAKRGEMGERGKVGDHGQDGRQGERGLQGLPGITDNERDVDRQVREALALALDEKRRERDKLVDRELHKVDRRLLIVYTLVAVGLIGAFAYDEHQDDVFRGQIVRTCEATNDGNEKVNVLLDTLRANAMTNTARTPEDRARIAQQYEGLHLPIVDCPPG